VMDSTGAAWLSRWRQRLQARGFQLVLLSPSPETLRALRHLRMLDAFPVAKTWSEAQGLIKAARLHPRPVLFQGAPPPLVWKGEVTARNGDEVWELTIRVLRSLGTRGVTFVIDLSQVPFIDSSGVAVMVRVSDWARQQGTEVRFADPRPEVLNVLKVTRLSRLLLSPA
jgi:anti-anti-sigma factor